MGITSDRTELRAEGAGDSPKGASTIGRSGLRAKTRLVLLVDDDPEIRALYGGALREAGLFVDEVVTIGEAIEVASRLAPDLVVLDRHLPDGDGWRVARVLKENNVTRAIPIVAFTSHQQRADVEGALVAGCDAFVAKPCDPATLVAHVRGMLDMPLEDEWRLRRSS